MDSKIIRKILTIVAIATLIIDVGMLIAAIFGLQLFNEWGPILKFWLSSCTLTVASAFAITATSYIRRQPILSGINLGLLAILSICAIVIYWAGIPFVSTFTRITATLAIFTVLFCILVGNRVKLGKKYYVIQMITFITVGISALLLIINIWGVNLFKIAGVAQLMGVVFLVAFAMLCTTSIMSRKSANVEDDTRAGVETITIPRVEYEAMKLEIQTLKDEIEKLKNQQ